MRELAGMVVLTKMLLWRGSRGARLLRIMVRWFCSKESVRRLQTADCKRLASEEPGAAVAGFGRLSAPAPV